MWGVEEEGCRFVHSLRTPPHTCPPAKQKERSNYRTYATPLCVGAIAGGLPLRNTIYGLWSVSPELFGIDFARHFQCAIGFNRPDIVAADDIAIFIDIDVAAGALIINILAFPD